MNRYYISVSSITYAIKGRDILRKLGYRAHTERKTNSSGGASCGYVIVAEGDMKKIVAALRNAEIKIKDIHT